ncbi:kinase-like domain-containing protein [Rhizophagus diaphanus]|nr:kinase-like domain-containing protein [Rhizophagus diaphanus] [Rhizophagus sp. MUCL 43196]
MEYADSGDLRNYLKQNFDTLTWDNKFKLAYQITEGIKYLHGEDILHRDLHSKNIVIHQGEAKIIDLGIAKCIEAETNIHSKEDVFGVIPYIDPRLLEGKSYKHNKKSDVYSLGVLMWELSSGYPPFSKLEDITVLTLHLIDGQREKLVPETPDKYTELYKSCWSKDPKLRPSIDEVYIKLRKMLGIQDDINNSNKIDNNISNTPDSKGKQNGESDKYDPYYIESNPVGRK